MLQAEFGAKCKRKGLYMRVENNASKETIARAIELIYIIQYLIPVGYVILYYIH